MRVIFGGINNYVINFLIEEKVHFSVFLYIRNCSHWYFIMLLQLKRPQMGAGCLKGDPDAAEGE
jgi:hypothetical protein